MRIRDYAESQGVSSQSIYKRIRSAKYKERLKGHLYLDNQKVENLDLIGIKILEDYHFEDDVIKLEQELLELRNELKNRENQLLGQLEKLEVDNRLVHGYLQNSRTEIQAWIDRTENLEEQRFYLIMVTVIIFLSVIITVGFAIFGE